MICLAGHCSPRAVCGSKRTPHSKVVHVALRSSVSYLLVCFSRLRYPHLYGLNRDVGDLATNFLLGFDVSRGKYQPPVAVVGEKVKLRL